MRHMIIAMTVMAIAGRAGIAGAQATPAPATPTPATASAEVMQCAQAQMVVDNLLAAATARLETARQSNAAVELRAAVDALQATLRDARAQLAPCGKLAPPADAHAGHAMPGTPAPAAPARPPVMKPGTPPTAPVKPAAPTSKSAPAVKPAASDPHAGHAMPAPAKPATPAKKPAAPAEKPATPATPSSDPHAGHAAAPAATQSSQAVDPVCGLKVDPAGAPKATHQAQTYYFCSEQHQQLFTKNPAKYLPKSK